MKGIKQKGEEYVETNIRLEAILEGIIYNPRFRNHIQKKYQKHKYTHFFQLISGYMRKKHGTLKDLNLYFTGVSHLDAAWLFPVIDTKERAYKTFYKAIEHCREFPFLTFAQTTPQYFHWIKCYDKTLWNEVKEFVKLGRIELTGGMWIEPSLDMPSGEALVRQRLYGQLFYLREFGFYPKMESLLDVFGFPWSLPQILVKSGATSFWTTKIMHNGGFPSCNFYWKGIDETTILTYMFTYNWDALDNNARFRKMARFPAPEHNLAEFNTHMTNAEMQEKFTKDSKDFNPNFGVFYGIGDGGKGPLELEVIMADSLAQLQNGIHSSQHKFMEKLKETIDERHFIWNDEMYLEYHRGVKTTQLEVKHYNRAAECWINAAETLITIVNLYKPAEFNFDKSDFFEMWQKLLFNQFHDILPGSSIPDVYELAVKEQKIVVNLAQQLIDTNLLQLKQKSENLIIFNPFNWPRSEYCLIDGKNYYFQNIPGLSIKQFSREELLTSLLHPSTLNTIQETESNFILKNKEIQAIISKSSGTLISLLNNEIGKEFISLENSKNHLGTGFRVFHEEPTKWHAWNLDKNYPQKKIKIKLVQPPQIITNKEGIMGIQADFTFLQSKASIFFYLRPEDKMLQFEIHTDLRDPKLLVKYFIPLNLQSEEVTSDIPYGSIARKRIKRTEMEKGKWEMNMQKWVDISDLDAGLTIVNNNRYGFNATAKGIYLTITRTPKYPGVSPLYGSTRTLPKNKRPKFTDLKPFDYKFGLYPHVGTWKEGKVWQIANDFNCPLILSSHHHNSNCKENLSKPENASDNQCNIDFLTIDADNVMVGAIKPSEWTGDELDQLVEDQNWIWSKKAFILRLVEQIGITTQTKIIFNPIFPIKRIEEVNLLEMEAKSVDSWNGNQLSIEMKKFEIKTLRIWFS